MGYFAYHGIVIGKGDPCFGGGKGSVIVYGYLCVGFCKKCMGKSIVKANE
jgi:hypothetical protein